MTYGWQPEDKSLEEKLNKYRRQWQERANTPVWQPPQETPRDWQQQSPETMSMAQWLQDYYNKRGWGIYSEPSADLAVIALQTKDPKYVEKLNRAAEAVKAYKESVGNIAFHRSAAAQDLPKAAAAIALGLGAAGAPGLAVSVAALLGTSLASKIISPENEEITPSDYLRAGGIILGGLAYPVGGAIRGVAGGLARTGMLATGAGAQIAGTVLDWDKMPTQDKLISVVFDAMYVFAAVQSARQSVAGIKGALLDKRLPQLFKQSDLYKRIPDSFKGTKFENDVFDYFKELTKGNKEGADAIMTRITTKSVYSPKGGVEGSQKAIDELNSLWSIRYQPAEQVSLFEKLTALANNPTTSEAERATAKSLLERYMQQISNKQSATVPPTAMKALPPGETTVPMTETVNLPMKINIKGQAGDIYNLSESAGTMAQPPTGAITEWQQAKISELAHNKGLFENNKLLPRFYEELKDTTGTNNLKKLTEADAFKVIDRLSSLDVPNEAQRTEIQSLVKSKMLSDRSYKMLMKSFTDQTDLTQITSGQAQNLIKAIGNIEVKGNNPPKIPLTTELVTKDFADRIPGFKEIGAKERLRPTRIVLEKMGIAKEIMEGTPVIPAEVKHYEESQKLAKRRIELDKKIGQSQEDKAKVFDAVENPNQKINLTPSQKEAVAEFKAIMDEWADRKNLPPEKRIKNYITHTFEASIIEDLKKGKSIDAEMAKAINFITPQKIFDPYILERTGRTAGLIRDPILALEAYESRELRVYYFQPLLDKLNALLPYMPPENVRYLKNFMTRVTNRPLKIDLEISQDFKELADNIEKANLPHVKELATTLRKGNLGALLAYKYTNALYLGWLGLVPRSAIRNLSQQMLAIAETNPIAFASGLKLRTTPEGKELLKKSWVLRSRKMEYLPGLEVTTSEKTLQKLRDIAMAQQKISEKENVSNSFLAGYSEAKHFGLPEEWAIRRGDEVAAKTQFVYSRLSAAEVTQSIPGRLLSPLTTYPANFMELMNEWIQGKPSTVYTEYSNMTGKPVAQMDWFTRRKALWIYALFVLSSYGIEKTTGIRATEYTGWGTIRDLADLLRGEVPGLDLIGGIANLTAGVLTADATRIKQGWNQVRPDKWITIIRDLENVLEGKADWLSLFVMLNPTNKQEETSLQDKLRSMGKSKR